MSHCSGTFQVFFWRGFHIQFSSILREEKTGYAPRSMTKLHRNTAVNWEIAIHWHF